jgi:hypothetical protein
MMYEINVNVCVNFSSGFSGDSKSLYLKKNNVIIPYTEVQTEYYDNTEGYQTTINGMFKLLSGDKITVFYKPVVNQLNPSSQITNGTSVTIKKI